MTEISIVIPIFNEEENIQILYSELNKILEELKKDYEIIFVDDGSNDRSFEILEKIHNEDKNVKIIKFRKNFGQTAAISAGFEKAKGEVVITMDADLQNDPNDIPCLLEKISEGYDVVSGWRKGRKDPFLGKKIPSKISNFLTRKLTGVNIHDFGCTLKAYKKEVLTDLELYGEMHRYIPAIVAWKGFRLSEIEVKHLPRKFGKSKYGIWRIMKGFLDLLVVVFWQKYSTRPIHLFGGLGILLSAIGALLGFYLALQKIFFNVSLANKPALLLAMVLVLVGIQFISTGLIADILIKLYYSKRGMDYSIEKLNND